MELLDFICPLAGPVSRGLFVVDGNYPRHALIPAPEDKFGALRFHPMHEPEEFRLRLSNRNIFRNGHMVISNNMDKESNIESYNAVR
jgi:hypothetical protein